MPLKSSIVTSFLTSQIPITTHSSKFAWWLWIIICGIFLIITTVLIILFNIRKKRTHEKEEILNESLKKKIEATSFNLKISHNKKMERQINGGDVEIDFDYILGKGANAAVYKGVMKEKTLHRIFPHSSDLSPHVAIKLPASFDGSDVEEFARELGALITIGSHSHIVNFVGWILYHDIPALVTELANTNLLQYVKSFRGEVLQIKTIISILWQISQALEHVASLMMVHRDVACRNILLTNGNVAKLADFGLCCHCDESFTYHASLQKRLPLKWLSIEALVDRLFTEKSDVWSFGILCYEVFSFGAIPYPTLSSVEMIEYLQAGDRLEKPKNTQDEIYKLMLDCWRESPQDRPNFKRIGEDFIKMLEDETSGYGYLILETIKIPK